MGKKVQLTDDEKQILKRVVLRTWDVIAADYLAASVDDGNYEKAKPISSLELAECCLDADRWRDHQDSNEMEPVMAKLREMGWYSPAWKRTITGIFGKGKIWGY